MGGSPGHSALIADPPGRGCGTCRNSGFNYLRGAAGNQRAGRGCGRSALGHHAEEGGARVLFSRALPPQTSILGAPTAAAHRQEPPSCLPSSRGTASSHGAPPLQAGSPCRAGDPLTVHPAAAPPSPAPAQYAARSLWALGRNSSFHTSFPAAAAAEAPAVPIPTPPSPPGCPQPHPLSACPPGAAPCSLLSVRPWPLLAIVPHPRVLSLCHHLPPLCAQHRSLAP